MPKKKGTYNKKIKWIIVAFPNSAEEKFSSCREIKLKYPFMYPNLLKLKKIQTLEGRKHLRVHTKLPYDCMKVYKVK